MEQHEGYSFFGEGVLDFRLDVYDVNERFAVYSGSSKQASNRYLYIGKTDFFYRCMLC